MTGGGTLPEGIIEIKSADTGGVSIPSVQLTNKLIGGKAYIITAIGYNTDGIFARVPSVQNFWGIAKLQVDSSKDDTLTNMTNEANGATLIMAYTKSTNTLTITSDVAVFNVNYMIVVVCEYHE